MAIFCQGPGCFEIENDDNATGNLVWANTFASRGGSSPPSPTDDSYFPFAGGANQVGDSGSPTFRRDGLNWSVMGTYFSTTGFGSDLSVQNNRDWIDQAILALGGQARQAPTTPTPTTELTGTGTWGKRGQLVGRRTRRFICRIY